MDSTHRPGAPSSADRLSALRERTEAPKSGGHPVRRNDLLIGVAVVLIGVVLVFALMTNRSTSVVTSGETSQKPVSEVDTSQGLLANEAFIPLSVEIGHFPPQLETGDVVQIAVTPGIDGNGETRVLQEEVTVTDISAPDDLSTSTVITIRAPQKFLADIASSGALFLSQVGERK
jgi:hypothetical protein